MIALSWRCGCQTLVNFPTVQWHKRRIILWMCWDDGLISWQWLAIWGHFIATARRGGDTHWCLPWVLCHHFAILFVFANLLCKIIANNLVNNKSFLMTHYRIDTLHFVFYFTFYVKSNFGCNPFPFQVNHKLRNFVCFESMNNV